MGKKIIKVGVFWLCLAGLVLCAHNFFPHDHHIADTSVIEDENCPASHNESDHHSGFPAHCHAFNDLVSEKFRAYQIIHEIQPNYSSFSCLTEAIASDLNIFYVRLFDLHKPIIDSYALESNQLRGPPILA